MIGFMYEGYFYCANVHRYQASTPEYHVTILTSKLKDGIPPRIIFKDRGHEPEPASREQVSPALLNTILDEIQKHSKIK